MTVREFKAGDIPAMMKIWNHVVDEGNAFPQKEPLTQKAAQEFFAGQSYTGVAEDGGGIVGLYILHPNNVGRCGHISNASYAVAADRRGKGVGRLLVMDCLERAAILGFGILQFNAVVKSNLGAIHLYKDLGFTALGTIPGGFLNKSGEYEDIIVFYKKLEKKNA